MMGVYLYINEELKKIVETAFKGSNTNKMIENKQTVNVQNGKTLRDEFTEFKNITRDGKLVESNGLKNRRSREMDIYEKGEYKSKPIYNNYREKLESGKLI
jgi:hypothetical protein